MNSSLSQAYQSNNATKEQRNRSSEIKGHNRLQNYLRHHLTCLVTSLQDLKATPFTNLMTIFVIGIALALPASLTILLNNVGGQLADWGDYSQLSVFLKLEADDKAAINLQHRLEQMPAVASTEFISREEALAEFDAVSGFGNLLSELPENPLPHVLLVTPKASLTPTAIQRLKYQLAKQSGVESVQYDLDWIKRLLGIIELGNRFAWFLGVLLGLGVLLIVSNTIRLMVQHRQDEIDIIRLIGATNGFVRRPFLYTGLWLGLFGSLGACIIIQSGLSLLKPSVAKLSELYQAAFALPGITLSQIAIIVAIGTILSVVGSWVIVQQQLRLPSHA